MALAPDEREARRLAAWWLSAYTTRMGPLYPRMLDERFGMGAGVDAIVEMSSAVCPGVAMSRTDGVRVKSPGSRLIHRSPS